MEFFIKCDQIRRKLQIGSHLLKRSLMENFICCVVLIFCIKIFAHKSRYGSFLFLSNFARCSNYFAEYSNNHGKQLNLFQQECQRNNEKIHGNDQTSVSVVQIYKNVRYITLNLISGDHFSRNYFLINWEKIQLTTKISEAATQRCSQEKMF